MNYFKVLTSCVIISSLSFISNANAGNDSSRYNKDLCNKVSNVDNFNKLGIKSLRYHRLDRNKTETVDTEDYDYFLFMKSHGHKSHKVANANWFRASGSGLKRVVGVRGSHDKAMMLVEVNKNKEVTVQVRGAVQILKINMDSGRSLRTLGLGDEADISKRKKTANDNKHPRELNGGLNPKTHGIIDPRKLDGADFSFYAEDQGVKQDRRQANCKVSAVGLGKGDDLIYLFTSNKKAKARGNGAIMHIDVR